MVDRIVPEARLRPSASPVDTFVTPITQEAPVTNGWLEAANALRTINPNLQRFLANRNAEAAAEQEAEGEQAEQALDADYEFAQGRDAWRRLVSDTRKDDPQQADRLAAASPHFRRGVIKARMNRLGMALNDHLLTLWRENPEFEGQMLHDIDDPNVVQRWIADQTQAYTDRFGLGQMDPILMSEVYNKRVAAAQDGMLSRHTEHRLNRYQSDYLDEMSATTGMLLSGAGSSDSDVGSFLHRLGLAENSGSWGGSNPLGYTGLWQFGQDRLNDYNRANGTSHKVSQMNNTPEGRSLQKRVAAWHIEDIDAEIDRQGFLQSGKGWSRDGLRAVAHLGGKGGMVRFVMSGGEYDPDDGYTKADGTKVKGTRLSDYYRRFSSPASALQETLDGAVADGMDPRKANATIVEQVINTARASGNPAVLEVLDDISTGNGTLGSIGWVREAMTAARGQIEDRDWKLQEREHLLEQRETEERRSAFSNEATRLVLGDPYADISSLQDQALDAGYTDIATAMGTLQQTLIERDQRVFVDNALVADLRVRISQGNIEPNEFYETINQGVANGLLDRTAATQLLDDFDNRGRYQDIYGDRQVQGTLSDFNRVISERFATNDIIGGRISGTEKGVEAEMWMRQRIMDWLKENPEATLSEARDYAESQLDRALKSPLWQPTRDEAEGGTPRPFGEVSNTVDELSQLSPDNLTPEDLVNINNLATSLDVSAQELMTRLGLVTTEGN